MKVKCVDIYLFAAYVNFPDYYEADNIHRMLIKDLAVEIRPYDLIYVRSGMILDFDITNDLLVAFTTEGYIEIFDAMTRCELYLIHSGFRMAKFFYSNGYFIMGTTDGRIISKKTPKADDICQHCSSKFPTDANWPVIPIPFVGIKICAHFLPEETSQIDINNEMLIK